MSDMAEGGPVTVIIPCLLHQWSPCINCRTMTARWTPAPDAPRGGTVVYQLSTDLVVDGTGSLPAAAEAALAAARDLLRETRANYIGRLEDPTPPMSEKVLVGPHYDLLSRIDAHLKGAAHAALAGEGRKP